MDNINHNICYIIWQRERKGTCVADFNKAAWRYTYCQITQIFRNEFEFRACRNIYVRKPRTYLFRTDIPTQLYLYWRVFPLRFQLTSYS